MSIDFSRTAGDYARHRVGFPPSFFDRLTHLGIGGSGWRALDLGTGTGTLARGLAAKGSEVVGLDPAEALIEEARRLDAEAGIRIDYVVGRAEATGLPEARFDLVTAGQCWHWFEREKAAAEARRLLGPGGRLVIAHFDWLPLPGNVARATEQLMQKHNPGWQLAGGTGLYPEWPNDLRRAGFRAVETFSYDLDVPYSHEAWRGRIRASAAIAASLSPDAVQRFDDEHAALLKAEFPEDPLNVLHAVFAAIGQKG